MPLDFDSGSLKFLRIQASGDGLQYEAFKAMSDYLLDFLQDDRRYPRRGRRRLSAICPGSSATGLLPFSVHLSLDSGNRVPASVGDLRQLLQILNSSVSQHGIATVEAEIDGTKQLQSGGAWIYLNNAPIIQVASSMNPLYVTVPTAPDYLLYLPDTPILPTHDTTTDFMIDFLISVLDDLDVVAESMPKERFHDIGAARRADSGYEYSYSLLAPSNKPAVSYADAREIVRTSIQLVKLYGPRAQSYVVWQRKDGQMQAVASAILKEESLGADATGPMPLDTGITGNTSVASA